MTKGERFPRLSLTESLAMTLTLTVIARSEATKQSLYLSPKTRLPRALLRRALAMTRRAKGEIVTASRREASQ